MLDDVVYAPPMFLTCLNLRLADGLFPIWVTFFTIEEAGGRTIFLAIWDVVFAFAAPPATLPAAFDVVVVVVDVVYGPACATLAPVLLCIAIFC